MNYLHRATNNAKNKSGKSPRETRAQLDAASKRDGAQLVEVIEMEGRVFRRFRAVTTDELVTK